MEVDKLSFKLLRMNMHSQKLEEYPLAESLKLAGGRRFIGTICNQEIDPCCSPLGEDNKLIITGGPLSGYNISSADRFSVGGKSPLTGGIKEANAGGNFIRLLKKLGISSIIIEKKPPDDHLYMVYLSKNERKILSADEYKGMGNYEAACNLRKRFGSDIGIMLAGPAAEMRMFSAGVFVTDKDGVPSRAAARGGMGAVMASKGLKAIVVQNDGDYKPAINNKEEFTKARKEFTHLLRTTPQTSEVYPNYGTAAALAPLNHMGALPTLNFTRGSFDMADKINGDALYDLIAARNGEGRHSHGCMHGCVIHCSNVVPDLEGKTIVSPLEYETLCLMGSNLGIGDLDTIARLNYYCNDIGLDTIEVGAAIGVALDYGMAEFGDEGEICRLVSDEIRNGTLKGRLLGSGAYLTAKVLGINRIPCVKRQAFAAHDPRSIKGMSVTYATTPMGADHTAGVTFRANIDHHKPEGQMEVSRNIQVLVAAVESLGFCIFVLPAMGGRVNCFVKLMNAVYGTKLTEEELLKEGKQTILLERKFNLQAGLTAASDRLPDFMKTEKNPPHNLVSDIPLADYQRYWDEEYWGELLE